jgi:hypothetical protein
MNKEALVRTLLGGADKVSIQEFLVHYSSSQPAICCSRACGCLLLTYKDRVFLPLARTVTDVSVSGLSPTGIGIAGISVVTSGLQQIMCGQIQRKHNLTANQLLSNSAPLQVQRSDT